MSFIDYWFYQTLCVTVPASLEGNGEYRKKLIAMESGNKNQVTFYRATLFTLNFQVKHTSEHLFCRTAPSNCFRSYEILCCFGYFGSFSVSLFIEFSGKWNLAQSDVQFDFWFLPPQIRFILLSQGTRTI